MAIATFVQEGEFLDYTPSSAVVAGAVINLGALIGIAKNPIAASALGAIAISGVFDFGKSGSSGPVFAIGDAVFWDSVNLLAVRTGGSGCWHVGTAIAAAATGDTSVRTRLMPHGLPADLVDKTWEDVTLAGGSKTLATTADYGKVMNVTVGHATNVVILPATAAGMSFTVRCGASGQRVAVSPNSADKFLGANLNGVADKDRILAAATSLIGDYMIAEFGATTSWRIQAQRGVWTNEP